MISGSQIKRSNAPPKTSARCSRHDSNGIKVGFVLEVKRRLTWFMQRANLRALVSYFIPPQKITTGVSALPVTEKKDGGGDTQIGSVKDKSG